MPRDRGLLRRARPEQSKPGWELRGAGCAGVRNERKWSGGHVVLDRDACGFPIGPGNRVPLDSAAHAAWQSQRAAELRLRRAQQRDTDHRDSEQRRVAALAARPDADAWTWLDAHGLRGFEDRERAPPGKVARGSVGKFLQERPATQGAVVPAVLVPRSQPPWRPLWKDITNSDGEEHPQ